MQRLASAWAILQNVNECRMLIRSLSHTRPDQNLTNSD